MKRRWRELLYITLIVLGLGLYFVRPERQEQWSKAAQWWKSALQYRGLAALEDRFQEEPALLPPADYSQVELDPLATFGHALQYLGCDTAATLGAADEVHIWLLTYWRCREETPCTYQVRYTYSPPGTGKKTTVVHLLEQSSTIQAEATISDTLLLPAAASAGGLVRVEVQNRDGYPLAARSEILYVERGTAVFIWQK